MIIWEGIDVMERLSKSAPDLSVRAVGSLLVVTVVVGGIISGGVVWDVLASSAALISLWEFYRLLSSKHDISPWLLMLSGVCVLLVSALDMSLEFIMCTITFIAFLALFIEVLRRQMLGESFALANMGVTIAGLAYIVMPWSFMILMRSRDYGTLFLFAIFCCTWACDTTAYFVGCKYGKHLLCERVSPGKTWEGAIGGVAAALLCGGFLGLFFAFPVLPMLLLGLICGISGQIGDLGESLIKREAGVKDTGSLIPGHGGFLDRFDSILINAAIAFVIFEAAI